MEIKQEPEFQPITITLETKEEAEALWAALERRDTTYMHEEAIRNLANWFCQKAQL